MTSRKSQSLSRFVSVCARFSLKALYTFSFVLLFLFASSASGQQTITTVQHNNGYTASGTSVAVAFNSDVTSGNLLLVAESSFDGESLETPTDTLGNTFVQLVTNGTSSEQSVAAVYAVISQQLREPIP
jgi:hypothetical protein